MNVVFSVKIGEDVTPRDYEVTVAAVAAKSTGDTTEAFIDKNKIELKNGTITVQAAETHEAAADWSYDETNHWHACTVDGCTEHKYDTAAHVWDEGTVTTIPSYSKDGTGTNGVVTYTCECGATKTEEIDMAITNLSYDHANSKMVYRYDLGQDFVTKLGTVKNLSRTVSMVITMNGKEYVVATSLKAYETRNVTGFTLNDIGSDFTIKAVCSYIENEETKTFESNAVSLKISDIIDDSYNSTAATDADKAIAKAYYALKEKMASSTDEIDVSFTEASSHTEYTTKYTDGKVVISDSKVKFTYDIQNTTFLEKAKSVMDKNRSVYFVVTIDGKEIELSPFSLKTYGAYGISGFTVSDFNKQISISLRLSYVEDETTLYITSDPVTVTIADEIAKNTTSELAIAFNNYNVLLNQ